MTVQMIGLGAAAVLALGYLAQVRAAESWPRSALKTGAVALLAVLAFGQLPLLGLALGLCALGDLALSRPGERAFLAGVASFAAGHLAYVALFLSRPPSDLAALLTAPMIWGLATLVLVAALMARVLTRHAGEMRGAVLAYVPVILAMALAALTLPLPLLWVAAVMFMFSDMVLALETFVLPPAHALRRITGPVIWVLYWGAQALFFAVFAM